MPEFQVNPTYKPIVLAPPRNLYKDYRQYLSVRDVIGEEKRRNSGPGMKSYHSTKYLLG